MNAFYAVLKNYKIHIFIAVKLVLVGWWFDFVNTFLFKVYTENVNKKAMNEHTAGKGYIYM